MRIAMPVADGRLSMHFGHAERFALVDVDEKQKTVLGSRLAPAPDHEPGVLPRWLKAQGVNVVITGGMGRRAQDLFAQSGVCVITGAAPDTPEDVAAAYLDGTLQAGPNVCDH
jgi:ATP-binding protein involved in chromosome partitioning